MHFQKEGVASKNNDATVKIAEPKNAYLSDVANHWPNDAWFSHLTGVPHAKHAVSSFLRLELHSRQRRNIKLWFQPSPL
jgi:hypothetical protein